MHHCRRRRWCCPALSSRSSLSQATRHHRHQGTATMRRRPDCSTWREASLSGRCGWGSRRVWATARVGTVRPAMSADLGAAQDPRQTRTATRHRRTRLAPSPCRCCLDASTAAPRRQQCAAQQCERRPSGVAAGTSPQESSQSRTPAAAALHCDCERRRRHRSAQHRASVRDSSSTTRPECVRRCASRGRRRDPGTRSRPDRRCHWPRLRPPCSTRRRRQSWPCR
jgi:hypothetical protein